MKKIFSVIIFLILVIAVAGFVLYSRIQKEAFYGTASSSNLIQDFEIKEGEGSKIVGEKLEAKNLIDDKMAFYFYVWKTGKASKLQAGIYELAPNMTIGEMVEKFSAGEIKSEIVKLTVPEGFNNKKIIELLRKKKPEIAEEFEEIANCKCVENDCACDVFGERYSFLKDLPKGVDMEGYLFPDTYFITKEDTGETLVSKFLNNFEKKVNQKILDDINGQEKTLHEIITMASVIEREVRTDEDRKIVSDIFWSRVRDDHALQSCATLAYVLGEDKAQFSYEDTRVDSPYNTYINSGLPPGPISNPGLASIKAAVYPQESPYYYFLSDPETGKIIYSKTSDEHSANKVKYGL